MYYKRFIWEDNQYYWKNYFKSLRVILFRFLVSVVMVLPAIFMAIFKIKIPWVDLLYSFLMGVILAFNFLFLHKLLFKFLKCGIAGDFFNEPDYEEDMIWE